MLYPLIDMRQLRYAIAVADELHFTRAAQKLHVTQSALTRQVRQLELQLGVDLFVRGTRRVDLTDAGRAFIEEARKVQALVERGIRRARGVARGELETLRIAYSPSVDVHFLYELRKLFSETQSDLRIEYVSEPVMGQVAALIDGTYHAGIGILPVEDEALTAVCLFQEPLFVVVAKSHRLARRRTIQVTDLANDPVIWMRRQLHPALHDRFLEWCKQQGYSPNIAQQVTSTSEALDFAAEGLGVAFVKASVSKLHSDGLAFIQLANPGFILSTGIICAHNCKSPVLEKLISRASAAFPCKLDSE